MESSKTTHIKEVKKLSILQPFPFKRINNFLGAIFSVVLIVGVPFPFEV